MFGQTTRRSNSFLRDWGGCPEVCNADLSVSTQAAWQRCYPRDLDQLASASPQKV